MEKAIKILAISGSLRQKSSNTALMKAIIALAPKNMEFTVYGGLGDILTQILMSICAGLDRILRQIYE